MGRTVWRFCPFFVFGTFRNGGGVTIYTFRINYISLYGLYMSFYNFPYPKYNQLVMQ